MGLKTGSTSKAKYCVSAVAKKNDLTMLAVVMGAPDYKVRFADAASLFQYGFSSCSIYIDRERDPLPELSVVYGKQDTAELEYAEEFRYLTTGGTVITFSPASSVTGKMQGRPLSVVSAPAAETMRRFTPGRAHSSVYSIAGATVTRRKPSEKRTPSCLPPRNLTARV